MTSALPGIAPLPLDALLRRRAALAAALGDTPALLVAGVARPRNYAANAYPFRAHSHFLYFFGWGAPGAVALFEAGRATVFIPAPAADDALWSGPPVPPAQLGAALGVEVALLDALPPHLRGRRVAFIHRPHQCRLPSRAFRGVHMCAVGEEDLQRSDTPRICRGHQCGLAFGQCGVRIRARSHEELDHRGVAIGTGKR